MEPNHKVLIVDKSIDRKKRINAIKQRGFAVFPALQLAEARSRCRPGAYDLIVVSGVDEPEAAVAFCDELRGRTPAQPVLLIVADGAQRPERNYVIEADPTTVADQVESALRGPAKETEDIPSRGDEDMPARASA